MTFETPAPGGPVYPDRSVGCLSLSAAAVMGALAIASFGASGCTSRRLSGGDGGAGVGGAAGRGGAAGDLAGAAATGGGGAGTAGGGGGDAGASGWPATLRLVNAGTSDVVLPELLDATCGFSISAAAAGAGASQQTSATPPGSWCDCDRCAAAGRRVCDAFDPICNGAPTKLVAGAHLDVAWDGRVAVIGGPPPSGSACPVNCDHWENVAAGRTTFTIETLSGSFTAEATLPASGIILLTINN
jgi:hypothetical protein